MSSANPLWGAPRIHGELLKLGIEVSQATVAKYMLRRGGAPSSTWRSFLRNHAEGIAAVDMFVVVSADAKLTQGRRLKTDPPRREVHRSGGPHAGGGESGGDPGLEQAGQERACDRTDARRVAQHSAALFTERLAAAL